MGKSECHNHRLLILQRTQLGSDAVVSLPNSYETHYHFSRLSQAQQSDAALFQDVGREMRSVNNHLVSVFNFVVTVLGSFVFAYKATEYSMVEPAFGIVSLQ